MQLMAQSQNHGLNVPIRGEAASHMDFAGDFTSGFLVPSTDFSFPTDVSALTSPLGVAKVDDSQDYRSSPDGVAFSVGRVRSPSLIYDKYVIVNFSGISPQTFLVLMS